LARQKRSDLQDFGDCVQSSQIGPHLVQPLRARPAAITLKISAHRLNMVDPLPTPIIRRQAALREWSFSAKCHLEYGPAPISGEQPHFMQIQTHGQCLADVRFEAHFGLTSDIAWSIEAYRLHTTPGVFAKKVA
jgi:hypothetical protein